MKIFEVQKLDLHKFSKNLCTLPRLSINPHFIPIACIIASFPDSFHIRQLFGLAMKTQHRKSSVVSVSVLLKKSVKPCSFQLDDCFCA